MFFRCSYRRQVVLQIVEKFVGGIGDLREVLRSWHRRHMP